MNRFIPFAIAAQIVPLAFLFGQNRPAALSDSARLQGWFALSPTSTLDGARLPATMIHNTQRFTIGMQLLMMVNGEQVLAATISIDTTKRPHTMDYVVNDGASKGARFVGLYDFKGDTLRLCFSAAGKPRPKALVKGVGNAFYMWTPIKK